MMENELKIKVYSFTLDCTNPGELAGFYAKLLKWEIAFSQEDWACVCAPGTKQGGYPGILFQRNPDFVSPVWPEKPDAQQQMAHIDLAVNDMEKAVEYAVDCGATIAAEQFSSDWTVMFDPAGHPFCLCKMKSIIDSPDFALK